MFGLKRNPVGAFGILATAVMAGAGTLGLARGAQLRKERLAGEPKPLPVPKPAPAKDEDEEQDDPAAPGTFTFVPPTDAEIAACGGYMTEAWVDHKGDRFTRCVGSPPAPTPAPTPTPTPGPTPTPAPAPGPTPSDKPAGKTGPYNSGPIRTDAYPAALVKKGQVLNDGYVKVMRVISYRGFDYATFKLSSSGAAEQGLDAAKTWYSAAIMVSQHIEPAELDADFWDTEAGAASGARAFINKHYHELLALGEGDYDEYRCPPGYFYDALHKKCCPDGFYWNEAAQTCRPVGH